MRTLSILLFLLPLSALGQDNVYLVRDLPGLTIHDSMGSGRNFWTNAGNTTWFTAMTAAGTFEIFKTDGTANGTIQVTHGSGVPESQHQGPFLGIVNGMLIYGGVDSGGSGVFALDTAGGDPVLLGRFQLSFLGSGAVHGNSLFFCGLPTSSAEQELWSTGGTVATTAKIDLLPGSQGTFNSARDKNVYSAGSSMFFFGTTSQGMGLHRTDGTIANTVLVLPLTQTALTNDTEGVSPFGNSLLFYLRTQQLWTSDGTPSATVQIGAPGNFVPLGVVGGRLLFDGGGGGIWTTDGTAAGTHQTDVPITNSSSLIGHVVGDRLFLVAPGFMNAKLSVTDGTAAGTHAIMDVNQGSAYTLNEGFGIGNAYYFRHDDGVHGMELWRTDGTTAELFVDINPGYRTGVDVATGFTRPDGKVLFAATNYDLGREPWITDGTPSGTQLLKNLAADDPLSGSSPQMLSASGTELFFIAALTGGLAIGTSDGTGAGTSANLLDFPNFPSGQVAANGHYFFSVPTSDLTGRFYASDGTSAGTTQIHDQSATAQPLPNGAAFIDRTGDLWFSDGTIAGTRKQRSFSSGRVQIFAGASAAWIANGSELWKTDGTEAGTIQVAPSPAPTQDIDDVVRSGSSIYFLESSGFDHGYRLWRSDGTAAGTTIVKDLGTDTPSFVGATDQMVYLSISGKLYRSDGTGSGTIALPVDNPCQSAAALGGALLFMSSTTIPPFTGQTTTTLWRSDGSAGGTTALLVMQPPKTDLGGGCRIVVRGNSAYFTGWDAAHGWELWQSDGTASGTLLTADIYPGTKSSSPQELTVAGSHVFFSADSPNIGRELWALSKKSGGHRAVRP